MTKHLLKTFVAFVAIAAMAMGPARAQIDGNNIDLSGESEPLSSDMTCTYLLVVNQGTLTVNQGVTLTLNCEEFDLKNNSAIHLHGTMTGSVGGEPDWNNNSYINVYLSDGAKYTVSGLECMDGDGYLRYYGYDAATDGHGTVSVTNGSTAVTASSIGYSLTTYTFTATPASGYHFVNWTKGAGGEELGTDASIDVTCEQNGQYQVYANFAQTPVPITVRMAAGTEEAANWSIASGNASVPGTQVLENVMSGSQVTATYSGTRKVKSVKAVKYVAPPTLLDNTTTAWADGKYAVPAGGLTYSDAITVSGNVTLVLTDGETLTLNKGISLASGATLTIQGNGTMNVNGTNESTASTVAGTGTLVLTSGTLTATGGNGGSVDVVENDAHGGNGGVAINGSVIVSGGSLTARGGNGGSVDFQCSNCSGGNGGVAINGSVTVNSGTLTATGGNGGSVGDYGNNCNGGAGSAAISGDLTINSGTETLTNGANGQLGQYNDECSAGAGGQAVAGTVTDNR